MVDVYFVFFKQKTAYDMRISDWSSDVCSSDLAGLAPMTPEQARGAGARSMVIGVANPGGLTPDGWLPGLLQAREAGPDLIGGRNARLHEIEVLPEARSEEETSELQSLMSSSSRGLRV